MSKQVGNLEEEALKRKERLKNLKRKFNETSDGNGEEKTDGSEKSEIPKPTFRNYRKDEQEITVLTEITEIKDQLDQMKTPLEINDIDVSNLAPRKIDYDLKRAIAKRLQKLEKKTQMAISELIRDRLKSQNEDLNIASLNVGAKEAAQKDVDSD